MMQLLRHCELWKLLFDEQDDSVAFMMLKWNWIPWPWVELWSWSDSSVVFFFFKGSGTSAGVTERSFCHHLWTSVWAQTGRLAHLLPFFFHFRLLPPVLGSSFALKSVKIKKEALDTVELLSPFRGHGGGQGGSDTTGILASRRCPPCPARRETSVTFRTQLTGTEKANDVRVF